LLCTAGHEYALTNLKFAASLQPENESVCEKLQEVSDRRSTKHSTVSFTGLMRLSSELCHDVNNMTN